MPPIQENTGLDPNASTPENAALEMDALKAENAELKAKIAKLEATIESLQATEKDGLPRASGTFTIALQGLEDAKPVKRKYRIAAGTVKVRLGKQVFSAQEVVDAASAPGGSLPGVPDLAAELAGLAAKKVAWLELV